MKQLMSFSLLVGVFLLAGCNATTGGDQTKPVQSAVQPLPSDPMEAAFSDLSGQIVAGLHSKAAKKIAVAPYQNLDGSVSALGAFVAEEMTTKLYQTGTVQVVEREMLNKVMAEHDLAASGLIDETTAKKIGRLLGVEAIATGTITDLTTKVRINSRLIATETGSVFSAAAVSLPKNDTIKSLMMRTLEPAPGPTPPGVPTSPGGSGTEAGVVYRQDFSSVTEGYLPEKWIGGAHLHVCADPTREGRQVLRPFEGGPYRLTIPDLAFPENWKLTVDFMLDRRGGGSVHAWQIGKLPLHLRNTGVKLKDTKVKRNFDMGQPARLELVKEGPVFKLFIDKQRLAMVRMDSFEPPQGLTITDNAGFTLYSIELEALP